MVLALTLLYYVLQAYFYTLILYILLSWIPDLRESKFYYYLHVITNPYLRLFRGIVVIGQFDFTPIIGFLFYQFGMMALGQFIASL